MKESKVRVRIAPSPTGFAHVGTAYTALFNYAFAKKQKGEFIVRLEDTDVKRHVKGAEEAIYEGLSWLGLRWGEGPDKPGKLGPYRQSERLEIYKKKAEELLDKNLAYKDEGAIRFKNPGKDIGWRDEVRGQVNFPGGEITDFVIVKSDGYPTYNFAVVIDDILMKISHVIRGEEHISNTPRQLALYKAFGEDPPMFAHLPTLRNEERKKLSKRKDPVNLEIYQKQGYLPEALVNFLSLLGWSHPKEEEIFDLAEFVRLFSLERVRKAGPIFDTDKLDWINGQYIRKLTDEEFASKVKPFAPSVATEEQLKQIAPLVKSRIKKFSQFANMGTPLFIKPRPPGRNLTKGMNKKHLTAARDALDEVDKKDWEKRIDDVLLATVDKNKFKTGDFFMSLRIAVFSSNATPSINESMKFIGKKDTIERIGRILKSK